MPQSVVVWQDQLWVGISTLQISVNAYVLLIKSPVWMFTVRQLSLVALYQDTAQNSRVLASCVSTAILESFPSSCSIWVGGEWEVRETVENRGTLWPFCGQAPKIFMTFIHIQSQKSVMRSHQDVKCPGKGCLPSIWRKSSWFRTHAVLFLP